MADPWAYGFDAAVCSSALPVASKVIIAGMLGRSSPGTAEGAPSPDELMSELRSWGKKARR